MKLFDSAVVAVLYQAQKKEQSKFYSDLLERRRTDEEKDKAKLVENGKRSIMLCDVWEMF